ncbi:uncharacterized protein LOC113518039 [Galleria mellonella]|uniref:Uncharacterized protein LOC113518039 n=1 Tax=Galleria mellonella TaxID=7137 RepID=A0A6J3CBG3_GALME|nr:uncharacterized protein LOC113518039 [Galleria mellonella]
MKKYINNSLFLFVILFLLVRAEQEIVNKEDGLNKILDKLHNTEVPDSALLILDRLNLKKISTISHYARHNKISKQEEQNSTSTSENRQCTCSQGVCKCCTGYFMDLINQKACLKVIYTPGDFAFDVVMSLNDRVLYENSMSGKNPKPMCISPPRLSNLKVCAKMYDVYFPGRNFHFCLAMTGQWRSVELFNMAFDCLRMGANGIAMMKPGEGGDLVYVSPDGGYNAVVDNETDDIEEYDENVVRSFLDLFE